MSTHAVDPLIARLAAANPVGRDPLVDERVADALLSRIIAVPREPEPARAVPARRRLRRAGVLALAGAVAVAGATYGAVRWSEDDLPPAGRGTEAFVLPATEMLPGGFTSRQAPRYEDLPPRPAILFPPGTSYAEAIAAYYAARERGEALPSSAGLTDPLPAGKVVQVGPAGLAIDPAAPVGYDLATGRVRFFATAPPLGARTPAPPLARCQVLLGPADSGSPDCPAPPALVEQVQEGGGVWHPAPPERVRPAPAAGPSSVALLERPAGRADAVPAAWRDPGAFSQFARAGARLDEARLALARGGERYWAIPAADGVVCLAGELDGLAASSCNPLSVLAGSGAILVTSRRADGRTTTWGLVADGYAEVLLPDGTTRPVRDNFIAITTDEEVTLRLRGPAGTRVVG